MLSLYHANRLEDLADQLAQNLKHPSGSILAPEIVAVPGSALSEWLTLHLARSFGICANTEWLLPARLLWKIFRAALPDVPETNAFSSDVLAWRVMKELQDPIFIDRFDPLRRYLESADALRTWQLSRQMGKLFEQYLIFRPDWIFSWEAKMSRDWQGALWHRLIKAGDSRHWLRLREQLFKTLAREPSAAAKLPGRVSLFALPGLSPAFLEWVARLADHTEVHVYHLNFSEGFWADIVSDRERARLLVSEGEALEPFLETGNRLLAAMGHVGRQHLSQLMGLNAVEHERYVVPERKTMLGVLQADIVELKEESQSPIPANGLSDRSVAVHVCHGPMREVEVLHDQLLDAFEQDPDLHPDDVRVLIPNPADYASAIAAIFGSASGNRFIPWSLAESSVVRENALMRALDALMILPQTRLDARRVHALLDFPFVRSRFGLDDTDVDQIERWIRELGIVWGADAESLAALGVVLDPTHTWRGGTDRMLLGFGVGDSGAIVGDLLPNAPGDSSLAEMLGRWRTFLEDLISLQSRMDSPRTLSGWISFLNEVVDEFFLFKSQESDALMRFRQALASLGRDAKAAHFEGVVPLKVIKDALGKKTADTVGGRFVGGSVTFSRLSSGRCLPAKLVCLIGMNASDFPGRENHHGLDQMAAQPRPGDRSRRDDDRFTFLEAVMSARERLYVSYSGAHVRDDRLEPPSNVVEELLKAVRARELEAETDKRITRHPLQAFSRRYFAKDSDLFSYAGEMVPHASDARHAPAPVFMKTLSPLEPGELPIDKLVDFFANPARALLRDRLGVRLEARAGFLPVREPMQMGYRSKRVLFRRAVAAQLEGSEKSMFFEYAGHSGLMPSGGAGESAAEAIWISAGFVCLKLKSLFKGSRAETLSLRSPIGGWQLSGEIDSVFGDQQVLWAADRISVWTKLEAWCRHLLLNAGVDRPPSSTIVLSPYEVMTFSPKVDASTELSRLVDLYASGMTRPLAFFPRSAFTWAEKGELKAAYGEWLGSEFSSSSGEATDPYFELAFRHELETALDGEFKSVANHVIDPLLEALVSGS